MTIYRSLTAAQRAQADYLFADSLLGTDPNDYEYELTGATVTSRSRIAKAGDGISNVHARKAAGGIGQCGSE